jgi:hypothetical protein
MILGAVCRLMSCKGPPYGKSYGPDGAFAAGQTVVDGDTIPGERLLQDRSGRAQVLIGVHTRPKPTITSVRDLGVDGVAPAAGTGQVGACGPVRRGATHRPAVDEAHLSRDHGKERTFAQVTYVLTRRGWNVSAPWRLRTFMSVV